MRPKTKAVIFKVLNGIIEVDRQLGRVLTYDAIAQHLKLSRSEVKHAFDNIRMFDQSIGKIFKKYHGPLMSGRVPARRIESVRKIIAKVPESVRVRPTKAEIEIDNDDTPDNNAQDQISFDAYECVAKHGELTAEQVAAMTGHPLANVAKELARLSTPVNEFDEKFQMVKARVNDRGQMVYSHGLKKDNNNNSHDVSKREIKRYRADSQAAFKTKYKAMKPVRREVRK
jgi:hypothetical protein